MSDEQFEQMARRIVWLTLATVGVSACGGGEPPKSSAVPPPPTTTVPVAEPPAAEPTASAEPPEPPAPSKPEVLPQATPQGERCREDGGVNLLAGLNPEKPVDYVGIFQSFGKDAKANEGEHVGARCAGASDERACNDALQALKPEHGFHVGCRPGYCAHGVAYTRGNEVGIADQPNTLKEFLGPVDTEGEAVLMAWAEGYNPGTCDELKKSVKKTKDGFELVVEKMTKDCPIEISEFKLKVTTTGEVKELSKKVKSKNGACVGRQSAGVALGSVAADDCRGRYFAECADLERAAVFAFARMASELEALGAPDELVKDARRSLREEERHVAVMDVLAERFRGEPAGVSTPETEPRGAFEVALENAVEGCVREAYGALVGLWQAEHAAEPEVRAALRDVAEEELRHAALSWRVAAWLEPRLSDSERERIALARGQAFAELTQECAVEPAAQLVRDAGLPTARQALALVRHLGSEAGLA
ncbi:MAG: ferritin-like domain-containing protein [Polyangiaceae bacterium]